MTIDELLSDESESLETLVERLSDAQVEDVAQELNVRRTFRKLYPREHELAELMGLE